MSMVKKGVLFVLLIVALLLAVPTAWAQEGLTVEALDALTLEVRWDGDAADRFTVSYNMQGSGKVYAQTVRGAEATLYDLVPGTAYEINVRQVSGGATTWSALANTPTATLYREHGFKRNSFDVFVVEDVLEDFWENTRHPVNGLTATEFESLLSQGALTALIDLSWDATRGQKDWEATLFFFSPDGGVYADFSTNNCDGEWTDVSSSYDMSEIVGAYLADSKAWMAGNYTLELYMDGQFAGRASFALAEGSPALEPYPPK